MFCGLTRPVKAATASRKAPCTPSEQYSETQVMEFQDVHSIYHVDVNTVRRKSCIKLSRVEEVEVLKLKSRFEVGAVVGLTGCHRSRN